jgi:GNAT superfamily N-acetyltransferase
VKTESELVAAANLNYVGSYRKLAEHAANGEVREVGPTVAFATGVPIALFNGCLVLAPAAAADIDAAVEWISGMHLPYRVWTDENVAPGLGGVLLAHGLQRDRWSLPGMVLGPRPEPPPPPAGIVVVPVGDGSLGTWLGVLVDDGMRPDLAEQLFPSSFAADPDVMLFTAYLDGQPVGTSIAIRTGDVSGIYGVITLPVARRRGVGTAAAWAAVNAGRQWGCDVVALQATEMGLSSYLRMGFKTVVRYATFNLPGRAD